MTKKNITIPNSKVFLQGDFNMKMLKFFYLDVFKNVF